MDSLKEQPAASAPTTTPPSRNPLAATLKRLVSQHWLVIALACLVIVTSVGWGVTALQLRHVLRTVASNTGAPNGSTVSLPLLPLLPPGAQLPSDAACAAEVPASTWEPRAVNDTANHSMPTAQQLAGLVSWSPSRGLDAKSDALRQRVTGHYTDTTDQILQWVACKWGVDTDIVRAQAVIESYWHMFQVGDPTSDPSGCPPQAQYQGSECFQTYGLLQIKYRYFKDTFPMVRQDTAFNADFVFGWERNCYEGWADYLYKQTPTSGYPSYHAGDMWGCLGFWYSGGWYDSGAISYINRLRTYYNSRVWLTEAFAANK